MFRSKGDCVGGVRRYVGLCAILAAAVVLWGCSKGNEKAAGNGHDDHDHHHHGEHATVGPNGGPIIEWGDHEHHLEITFDRQKQQATVYVLDHDAKKAQPTAVASMQLKLDGLDRLIPLEPSPLEGETADKASRYVATDPALAGAGKFNGAVSGTVDQKPYFGSFKEGDAKSADSHDEHDGHDDHDEQ